MARIKFKGNRAAASKAAKATPTSFKVYDGPQPPRAPYRLRLINMKTKYNKNSDPYFSIFAAIDEPVKKNGKTNPKAQYNGATIRGSSNQAADYAEIFNSFLQSFGCSSKDIAAIWNTGVETVDNPKGDDFVKSLGSVKIHGADVHFYGLVDLEVGDRKPGGGKYPDKLSVDRFLTPNDIMGASDSPEDDEDMEEDDELDPDEVNEDEDEDEDEDEAPDEEDEEAYEERQTELEGMTRAALKALLKPLGSDMKVTTKVTDEQIIEEILGLEFPEDGEAASDEEEEGEEGEEEDDLTDLDRAGLKALIKQEELEVRVFKSMSDENIREAITMARGEAAEEVEEEADEPPAKPISKRRSKASAGEPPF